MARNITGALNAKMKGESLEVVFLVEFQYPSGDIRLWNGSGGLDWNARIWSAAGEFLRISAIKETEGIVASGMVFALSGIPSAAITNALGTDYQDRPVLLYIGVMDTDMKTLVADPYLIFEGRMDVQTINDGGQTATVEVTAESHLVDLRRARKRTYTPEDQAIDFPADKGLDFIASLQSKDVIWKPVG